jgi:hypothetical protein
MDVHQFLAGRPDVRALKSVQKMMEFVEANYARNNQINRDDIVQQGGNDENQNASQKR